MRILLIVRSLANGGAEKFTVEVSNELSNKNEVILCSIKSIENWMYPPKSLSDRVKLISFNIESKFSLRLFFKLIRLLLQEKPEIVHVHSGILMFYFVFHSLLFNSIRFVHTVHNTLTPGYKKLFDFLSKVPIGKKKFIHVCISEKLFEIFHSHYHKLNFKWVNNGIQPLQLSKRAIEVQEEASRLKKSPQTKVFIAIGKYNQTKNFAMLARVFKRLEVDGQNVILLIIGKANEVAKGQYAEVSRLKGRNTHLIGERANIADYLNVADALVSSSLMEGMPLVILEAFCMGLPVIATPAGGVVDLIESGANGLIASGFQDEDLYSSLMAFLMLPEGHIRNMQENNKIKFRENYTMESCARKYMKEVYRGDLSK